MNNSVIKLSACFLLTLVLGTSCGSKYNKTKFEDPNAENADVYGDVNNTEPLQLANPAAADPAVGAISKEVAPKFRERIEQTIQR